MLSSTTRNSRKGSARLLPLTTREPPLMRLLAGARVIPQQ